MNQEKIGKFIAENRKKQNLTQEQLAVKLNISINAVSKWERGLNLPDVSLMLDLCNLLKISLNELFIGEKIKEEKFKEVADKNLIIALENSSFTLKEKIEYFRKKWLNDHFFELILGIIIWIGVIIGLNNTDSADVEAISVISGFVIIIMYIFIRKKMYSYIEKNIYHKLEK